MSNQRKILTILAVAAAAQVSVPAHAQQVPLAAAQAQAATRDAKPIRLVLLSAGRAANPVQLRADEALIVLSPADTTPEQLARLMSRARFAAAAGVHAVKGAMVRVSGPPAEKPAPPLTETQRRQFERLLGRLRAAEVRSSAEHGEHRQLVLRPAPRGKRT
jgi:hypothetical protein